MFRSVALVIFAVLTQMGCCCCNDFMRGFNKGFNDGMKRGQQAQQQVNQEQQKQEEENKARAELQQLVNKLGPNTYGGTLAPGNAFWTKLKQTTSQRTYVTHPTLGGGIDRAFTDVSDGGVLIGFFASDDGEFVAFLQPIYLTSQGERVGKEIGRPRKKVQVLKAKAGYAVGGVSVRAGMVLNAATVIFMKVEGDRLDVTDKYNSAQVGGVPGGMEMNFLTKGPFLVGFHGKQNNDHVFSPPDSPNCLGFLSLP